MNTRHTKGGVLGLVVVALAAAGCRDNGPSAPHNTTITDAQAQVVGRALSDQIGMLSGSLTAADITSAEFPGKMIARAGKGTLLRPSGDCPAVSDPTDSDGDGIPDDATYTFDENSCMWSDSTGTVAVSGAIRVTDPGSQIGYNATYSDFQLRFTDLSNQVAIVRLNGTQGVSATSRTIALSEVLTIALQFRSGDVSYSGTIQQNWGVTFTADAGQVIDLEGNLPDGSFTINGTSQWAFGRDRFSLALTTERALVYDAQCALDPQITAGELRAHVEGNDGGAYIGILYTGCGEPPIFILRSAS